MKRTLLVNTCLVARILVAKPIDDAPSRRVVAAHLDLDLISRQHPDVILPDLPGDVPKNHVLVVQADAEHAVGQGLDDDALVGPLLLLHALRHLLGAESDDGPRGDGSREGRRRRILGSEQLQERGWMRGQEELVVAAGGGYAKACPGRAGGVEESERHGWKREGKDDEEEEEDEVQSEVFAQLLILWSSRLKVRLVLSRTMISSSASSSRGAIACAPLQR